MQATQQQVALLQHTLGLRIDRREPYRNYFVADHGHHDMPDLEALEASGLMCRGRTPKFCHHDDIVFMTTDAGRSLAIEQLPPEPKRTRYAEYLATESNESFAYFLCGERLPKLESECDNKDDGKGWRYAYRYRMYRSVWDGSFGTYRDVQGEWANTKKAAKASYKKALSDMRAKEASNAG